MKGKKFINYVKSEYIGCMFFIFCGILIVFVMLVIIVFICEKGI